VITNFSLNILSITTHNIRVFLVVQKFIIKMFLPMILVQYLKTAMRYFTTHNIVLVIQKYGSSFQGFQFHLFKFFF